MSCHRSLKFDLPFPRGLIEHAMPCHFGDPDAETDACQNSAAVFNFSFIIRLQISGPDAARKLLQRLNVPEELAKAAQKHCPGLGGDITWAFYLERHGWLTATPVSS